MSEYKEKLAQLRTNPNMIINMALNELQAQLEGRGSYDIPNGNIPFVYAIEHGTMMAALAMDESRSSMRRLYRNNAIAAEDLYLHMADDDYLNRFATPAVSTFEFYINKDEIVSKMVPVGDAGIKQVIIPRGTQIKVAQLVFTTQYPIIIRQMRHGGVQTVYDLSTPSPLQTLNSNLVDSKELYINNQWYLLLKVPVYQFECKTIIESLNPSSPFEGTISFTQQFLHARAYISNGNGGWTEIHTTHSDQSFDPTRLTLCLKVVNGKLHVEFPLVYSTNGTATGELRIDIYTTQGEVDVDLGSYDATAYTTDFLSLDDDKTYTNPLEYIAEFKVINPNRVQGGGSAVSFETLRNAVIDGVIDGAPYPITGVQLSYYLERRGYGLVTTVNDITHRQFLATRRLPPPTNGSVATAVGTVMAQTQASMEQLSMSKHVMDNGERITIMPTMLFTYDNGIINVVDDGRIASLVGASPESQARRIIDGKYLYTPFHYVLDASSSNFDVRPYYFGAPSIVRKSSAGDNDTSQLQVTLDTYSISRIESGFRLRVKLKSDEQFKKIDDELIVLQLGYRPVGEKNYAALNGKFVGLDNKERVFEFDILTRFDVDSANSLYTTNCSMFDLTQTHYALGMEHDLDFTVIIDQMESVGYVPNDLDDLVQGHLLSHTFMTIKRERLTVRFGYELTDLWRRNRTVLSEKSYRTYPENVMAYYGQTIFETDSDGQRKIQMVNGKLDYKILHRKGDPVLDAKGQHVIQFEKGTTMLDAQNQPILLEDRQVSREFTLFLVDGMYYFATEASSLAYRQEIPMQVVNWIKDDIQDIRRNLLDEAEISLYPITTFGRTTATVRDGLLADVSLDQSLSVIYYMDAASYGNTALRPSIIASTKEIVARYLTQTRVVRSDIIAALKLAAGDDVSGVEVSGIGGTADFGILTLSDESVRLSLRKKPTVLSNEELMVEDDLTINFLRHQ